MTTAPLTQNTAPSSIALDDALLTIPEVCAILKIGKTKTWELIANGRLQAVRLGTRCTRVRRSSLQALMEG